MKIKSRQFVRYAFVIILDLLLHYGFSQQIAGVITNEVPGALIHFSYTQGLVTKQDSAFILAPGSFTKKFNFNQAEFPSIKCNSLNKTIYIFPGGKFKISFDPTNKVTFNESFKVTGDYNINRYLDSINENNVYPNYLASKVNIRQPIDSFRNVIWNYRIFCDSVRNRFFKNRPDNKTLKPLNDFLFTDSINWLFYSILAADDYSRIFRSGNIELFRQEEITKRLVFQASSLYLNAEYYRRCWKYIIKSAFEGELRQKDSIHIREMGFPVFAIQYINSRNIKGKLKDLMASQILYDILETYNRIPENQIMVTDSLISALREMIDDKAFQRKFDITYEDKKRSTLIQKRGQKAPDFLITDTADRHFNLNDFKGKIVLMDIWASWCLPCVEELPYLRELENKVLAQDRPFELLTVSIDDSKDIWMKNGLLKFDPPGHRFWVMPVGRNRFIEDYNCELIPKLILLDKEGKIINFNAPRASDGTNLYDMILKISN